MKMWKKNGILACIAVVAMDITAGILALKAEATQNQVKHLRLWLFECKDPSNQAYKLGLAAVILLSLAHALANFIGGCTSCTTTTAAAAPDEHMIVDNHQLSLCFQAASPSKQCSLACLILTWVVLAIGLYLLVTGISSNNNSLQASCGFSSHHFFSIGGIFCFLHAAFSVAYYVTATATQTTPLP